MTNVVILGILILAGLLLVVFTRSKNATIEAKDDKIEALEKAAADEREAEEAADAKTAEELVRTGDRRRTIDWVRDSFKAGG